MTSVPGSNISVEEYDKIYDTFVQESLPVRDHFLRLGTCQVIDASKSPNEVSVSA